IRAELGELKDQGVRLAIDDFGTGYSSLSYLRELPMDVLKIDKSFTEGTASSQGRLALVEVIVRMARTLGLTVTAEGIESEAQRELLISLGCETGQGYLLAKPVAADEAQALVRSGLLPPLHAGGGSGRVEQWRTDHRGAGRHVLAGTPDGGALPDESLSQGAAPGGGAAGQIRHPGRAARPGRALR